MHTSRRHDGEVLVTCILKVVVMYCSVWVFLQTSVVALVPGSTPFFLQQRQTLETRTKSPETSHVMCPRCAVASGVWSLKTIWPIFHRSRGRGEKQPVKREQITENSSKAQIKEICLFNWLHVIKLDWGKKNIGQSAVAWWWEAKDKERVRGFPSRCDHCCCCCYCCCGALCLFSQRLCGRQARDGVSLHASLDASSGLRPNLPSRPPFLLNKSFIQWIFAHVLLSTFRLFLHSVPILSQVLIVW